MYQKKMDFTNRRGQKIAAEVFVPGQEGEDRKYPTVIFSHGFGGNYRLLHHHGPGYAEAGIVCMFFDFCGGGMESLSQGSMRAMTIPTEQADLEDVIKFTRDLPYVDGENFFLQGESMGGFVTAHLLGQKNLPVKGQILWYPAFVIPDDSQKRFDMDRYDLGGLVLSADYNETAMKINIFEEIRATDLPTLLIHGDRDELVPIAYSRRAHELYPNSEFIVLSEAGHGFENEDSQRARQESIRFILNHVGGEGRDKKC